MQNQRLRFEANEIAADFLAIRRADQNTLLESPGVFLSEHLVDGARQIFEVGCLLQPAGKCGEGEQREEYKAKHAPSITVVPIVLNGFSCESPGPPPPPRFESYGGHREPGHVWINGYWGYSNRNYNWVNGYWGRRCRVARLPSPSGDGIRWLSCHT